MMQNPNSIEEAVIRKAEEESKRIIDDAEGRAQQILRDAEQEKNKKLEDIKQKSIEKARKTAEQLETKAKTEAKKTILARKKEIIIKITEDARKIIEKRHLDYNIAESLRNLLSETLPMFPQDAKLNIFVNPKDIDTIKLVLRELSLSNHFVKSRNDILGGVILESSDGLVKIDNSYDSSLKNYLQMYLPEISRIIFESR